MFTLSSTNAQPQTDDIKYEETLDLENYNKVDGNPGGLSIDVNSFVTSEKCDNIPNNDIVIILPEQMTQIDDLETATTCATSHKNLLENDEEYVQIRSEQPDQCILVQKDEKKVPKSKSKRKNAKKKIALVNVKNGSSDRFPEHLKERMTKAKGDAQIKEFVNLVCEICQNNHQYRTFKDVQEHFKAKHQIRGYVICCDKKFHRKDRLMNHITNHINPDAFK